MKPWAGRGIVLAVGACGILLASLLTASAQTVVLSNVRVSAPSPPGAYSHPDVAIDPANSSHVVVAYDEALQSLACHLASSSDGGNTWLDGPVVGSGAPYQLPAGQKTCGLPRVVFQPDGALVYAFDSTHFGSGGYYGTPYAMRSTDGGATFSAPTPIDTTQPDPTTSAAGVDQSADNLSLAVDKTTGRVYATWARFARNFTGADAATGSSLDGVHWSSSMVLTPDVTHSYGVVPVPGVGADGELYVVYQTGTAPLSSVNLTVRTSQDHGATFAPAVVIAASVPAPNAACGSAGDCRSVPFQSVSGLSGSGSAAVAWSALEPSSCTASNPPGCSPRVHLQTTSDGGASWSQPRIVGVPSEPADHSQTSPALSLAPDGRLDLVFFDDSPATFNCIASPPQLGFQDTFFASSADGGGTFSAPERLDSVTTNVCVSSGNGGTFDYQVNTDHLVASTNAGTDVVWTDSRNGTLSNAFHDIYFSSLSFAPSAPSPASSVNAAPLTPSPASSVAAASVPVPATGTASHCRPS
ncbi:MAG: sialidase family protein [Candidatus Dormibacteria bacterium]